MIDEPRMNEEEDSHEALEPCPLCGWQVTLDLGVNDYNWIQCSNVEKCGISLDTDNMPADKDGRIDRSPEALVKRWNDVVRRVKHEGS